MTVFHASKRERKTLTFLYLTTMSCLLRLSYKYVTSPTSSLPATKVIELRTLSNL